MSQPAYSKLESGQTKLTIERANKIAIVFDVDPEYFFAENPPFLVYKKDNDNSAKQSDIKRQELLYNKIIREKDLRKDNIIK